MKKLILVCFCLSLAACATSDRPPQNATATTAASNSKTTQNSPVQNTETKFNPAETVGFAAQPVELNAGSTTQAEIKLTVVSPYHVNSNPPSEKTYIPLEVSFENANGVTVGKPVYPAGQMKKFAFSEDTPLSVYEGEITVKVPLKAERDAKSGQTALKGKLSFQPCDEEVCYRPQKIDINLPVTIN